MASPHANVDAYLASQPATNQPILAQVRATIRQALPEAEEIISYSIPAYRLHKRNILYFAGWAHHYSLYPITPPVVTAFKAELAPFKVNNKGTARFPLDQPVPTGLIARIAVFLANTPNHP
jgi:uncharacterized protein YdhG (YjbR/CyaY superfamily)